MNMNPNILSVGVFPTSDALYRTSGAVLNEQEKSIVSPECNVIMLGALHCRPDAMEIKHGFSHISERVRVKKLAHESRIRIATWNIGTLTGKLMDIKRIGDRIILLKLVIDVETINIISAYAPQIGLDDTLQEKFWEDMDGLVQGIPSCEKLYIGGEFKWACRR